MPYFYYFIQEISNWIVFHGRGDLDHIKKSNWLKNLKKASRAKMQKNIIYKCGNEASFAKKHLQSIEPSWTLFMTSQFSRRLENAEEVRSLLLFFWSQSRRKTFKRNPDLQVSILSLESELQNGIQSHILYLSFSSRAVRFWLIKCCFVPRAKLTSTYTWFAIFSIGYLQCSDQPYLLISQLDSETPVYGCKSWTQFN